MEEKEKEIAAALQAVADTEDPRLILNDPDRKFLKGNQRRSGAWLQSPAYLVLSRMAVDRLAEISEQRGIVDTPVLKVRSARLKGQKHVYLYPTHEEDPEGILVKYYRSTAFINLVSLLGGTNLTVESGYRVWYELKYASPKSPVGPALVFDLGRPVERRSTARRRKSPASPVANT